MAKNPVQTLVTEITTKVAALAAMVGASSETTEAEEPTEGEESAKIDMPTVKEILKLGDDGVTELCEQLQIDTEGKKVKALRAVLILASKFAAEVELTKEEIAALAGGLGLAVSKKDSVNRATITEYLGAEHSAEEAAAEETADDDETPEETADEESTEEETEATEEESEENAAEEDDDEEEEPAKKGKKSAKEARAEDEEAAADYEETEEETAAEEDEGPSDAELKKLIPTYNEHAEKKLKKDDVTALRTRLTGDDGKVYGWGVGYTRKNAAYSCGFPLEDHGDDGKCRVTDKVYTYDSEDNLVEVKPAKKTKK